MPTNKDNQMLFMYLINELVGNEYHWYTKMFSNVIYHVHLCENLNNQHIQHFLFSNKRVFSMGCN